MKTLRYKKVEKIKLDSNLVASGAFKPTKSSIIIIVVGAVLMFLSKNIWFKGLGAFFIAIAAFVLLFVKDKKTIDIYENGVLIYNPKDNNLAYYLKYKDIEEWDISHDSGHDTVEFTLKDKNRAVVDTFQTNKVYSALDKIVPEKNHLAVQKMRNKEMNISPIDALKNLVAKKRNK